MHGAAHFRCYVSGELKYSEHVRAKLIKANKCLFGLRSLRKEGFSQGEVDHLFSALVLPNFTYGLPVYGAVDSDLTVIHVQNFVDRCFKRKYTSKRTDIRELLEKADKKLFKVRSVDPDCPLSNIIQKKKETNYRIYSVNRPGRLLSFLTLRVGALIRDWAFIKFSPFSAGVVCQFCNNIINGNNKTRRCNKARFL